MPDGHPSAIQLEQGRAACVRHDLHVIAAGDEIGARACREQRGAARVLELPGEEVRHQRLGRRVGRVVDDEAVRSEDGVEEPAERLGDALPGRVRGPDNLGQPGREFRARQHAEQACRWLR